MFSVSELHVFSVSELPVFSVSELPVLSADILCVLAAPEASYASIPCPVPVPSCPVAMLLRWRCKKYGDPQGINVNVCWYVNKVA